MRIKSKKSLTFNSPALVTELIKLATTGNRWFELIPEHTRVEFVEKYCTWIYTGLAQEDLGAACVVVSYPRPNGKVRIYNLDGGGFQWVPVQKLTKSRRVRLSSPRDYQFSSIMMHDDRPESEDIECILVWACDE